MCSYGPAGVARHPAAVLLYTPSPMRPSVQAPLLESVAHELAVCCLKPATSKFPFERIRGRIEHRDLLLIQPPALEGGGLRGGGGGCWHCCWWR